MTHDQSILDKIAKLMALGESANPHEAALAMAKAQELLAKSGLSVTDVKMKDIKHAKTPERGNVWPWERILADACGRAFGTLPLINRGTGQIQFVGNPVDVVVSIICFEGLREGATRMANAAHRADGTSKGDYSYGYALGVHDNTSHMAKDKPTGLEEWAEANEVKYVKLRQVARCDESTSAGWQDGKKVRIDRNQLTAEERLGIE